MDVRYQVFISSTFADLKDERNAVFRTVMEMDCMPAGMELFPAMDEEQWEFIKRVIDDCDYYLLIIGGRYGSMSSDGMSYTEKEFAYAVDRGLKVIAFIHENPEELSAKNTDGDPVVKAKLDAFREKVCEGRLVRFWKTGTELPGLVALSLVKTIKTYPAVGWVRANTVANEQLLLEQNDLRKENEKLKGALLEYENRTLVGGEELAAVEETFDVILKWSKYYSSGLQHYSSTQSVSWKNIFTRLAPDLQANPNEQTVNALLGKSIYRIAQPSSTEDVAVEDECFKTIKVQLMALGLVTVNWLQTVKGGYALFWGLTDRGKVSMLKWRTIKAHVIAIPDSISQPSEI